MIPLAIFAFCSALDDRALKVRIEPFHMPGDAEDVSGPAPQCGPRNSFWIVVESSTDCMVRIAHQHIVTDACADDAVTWAGLGLMFSQALDRYR